jgi:hypothetical protein
VYLTPSTSVSSSIHDTNDVAEEEGPPRYNFMDSSRDANRNLVLPKSSSSSLAAKVGPKTRKPNGTSREQENVKDDPTEKNAFSDDKKNDDDGFHHQRNNTLPAVAVAVATTVALKPVDDAARRPRLRTNVNQTIVTFNIVLVTLQIKMRRHHRTCEIIRRQFFFRLRGIVFRRVRQRAISHLQP